MSMTSRYGQVKLPTISIIDSRIKENTNESCWPFQFQNIDSIKEALEKNEQVLVFVNRLGFSNYLQCTSCGHFFECPNFKMHFLKHVHVENKNRDKTLCVMFLNKKKNNAGGPMKNAAGSWFQYSDIYIHIYIYTIVY